MEHSTTAHRTRMDTLEHEVAPPVGAGLVAELRNASAVHAARIAEVRRAQRARMQDALIAALEPRKLVAWERVVALLDLVHRATHTYAHEGRCEVPIALQLDDFDPPAAGVDFDGDGWSHAAAACSGALRVVIQRCCEAGFLVHLSPHPQAGEGCDCHALHRVLILVW